MSLVQLIYASTASDSISINDLREILSVAKQRNADDEITGFLCADKHYFLQCIEGELSQIDSLFSVIEKDPRHHDLIILSREKIENRSFPQWCMGGVLEIERHKEILAKFNSENRFQPYELNEEESLQLLKEFAVYRGMTQ